MAEITTKTGSNPKILCMFSGGLDSLAVLYLLLTRPEYKDKKIAVHHLVMKNVENRERAEALACQRILKYLKAKGYRPFEYTESEHDFSFMRRYFIYDSVMYGFVGANMMINDPSIEAMAIGSNGDDRKDPQSIMRANKGKNVFHAILPDEVRFQKPYIYPVAHMSKQEIWNLLPNELRQLAWSCRRPVWFGNQFRECQSCKACKELNHLKWGDYQANWAHRIGEA